MRGWQQGLIGILLFLSIGAFCVLAWLLGPEPPR